MVFENFILFMNKILLFSSFINSATGFPKPLSPEEERKYYDRFKKGDKKAKDILINHNLRLVAHIVKKYSGAGEADDLISVGAIGLIKAINTFKYGKGTQLSTYAARCIENEILMLIRVNKKHKGVISLQENLGQDKDGNEVELLDIIPSLEDEIYGVVENNIINEKVCKLIDLTLPKREADILKMRYGIGGIPALTQREVAVKLGISRSYISRLETKALATIKEYLKDINEVTDL
ncbi:MAG: RNA polymerase sporulation sigma factor SigK [Clostridia bacterium]|nr:RNA polymerase sporulation sigma factor SigK [Clostridia bacterium]MDD4408735.1 RNA polymerase sporulation sigma factor SigK [Clostridia bacterium]